MIKTIQLLALLLCLSIYSDAQCDDILLTITSTTGDWGNEMSWELFDSDYNQLASFQGVSDNSSEPANVA